MPEFPGTGESGWAEVMYVDIVKGTEVEELAKVFQRIAHEVEPQVEIALLTGYSPVLEEALEQLFAEAPVWAERFPTGGRVAPDRGG